MVKTEKNIKPSDNKKEQVKKQTKMMQEKNHKGTKKNKNTIVDEKALERNKYVFELVNMWLANADNKINIVFAMLSAIVAVIVFIAENMLSDLPISPNADPCLLHFFYGVVIIAALSFCLSILFYILSIIPRLTSDKSIKNKLKEDKEIKYSIFYDEIKDFEKAEKYVEVSKVADMEMFNEQILKEIYYNSGICSKKMNCIRCGGIAFL